MTPTDGSTKTASSTSATSSATGSAASDVSGTNASSTSKNSSSGSSKISGGAIGGIVVGVIAALAILALILFFWRRRANSRNDAYIGGNKSPSGFSDPFGVRVVEDKTSMSSTPGAAVPTASFGGLQPPDNSFMAVDQRLNPVMLGERRLSEGSIADERDYSRKILRVANPDA